MTSIATGPRRTTPVTDPVPVEKIDLPVPQVNGGPAKLSPDIKAEFRESGLSLMNATGFVRTTVKEGGEIVGFGAGVVGCSLPVSRIKFLQENFDDAEMFILRVSSRLLINGEPVKKNEWVENGYLCRIETCTIAQAFKECAAETNSKPDFNPKLPSRYFTGIPADYVQTALECRKSRIDLTPALTEIVFGAARNEAGFLAGRIKHELRPGNLGAGAVKTFASTIVGGLLATFFFSPKAPEEKHYTPSHDQIPVSAPEMKGPSEIRKTVAAADSSVGSLADLTVPKGFR